MTRIQATPSTVHFGKTPSNVFGYKAADWFLSISHQFKNTRLVKVNPDNRNNTAGKKVLNWIADNVLTTDYHEMGYFSAFGRTIWGRVLAEPPMGAMTTLLFGPTLLGRLHHALKRVKEHDTRELGDILRRDIPTFVTILYLLPYLVRGFSKQIQSATGPMGHGIRLIAKKLDKSGKDITTKKDVYSFGQIEQLFTVKTPDMLLKIVNDDVNHVGIRRAVKEAIENKNYSQAIRNQFKSFKNRLSSLLRTNPDSVAVKEAYEQLAHMDKQIVQLSKNTGKQLPLATEVFTRYALKARVLAALPSHAIMAGILGVGIVSFNAWWAHRQWIKKYASGNQAPTQRHQSEYPGFVPAAFVGNSNRVQSNPWQQSRKA